MQNNSIDSNLAFSFESVNGGIRVLYYSLCCMHSFLAVAVFLRRLGFFDGFDDEHGISVGISWNCRSDVERLSWFKASGILKVAIDQFQMLSIVHL